MTVMKIIGDGFLHCYHLPVIFHVLYQDENAVDETNKRNQYVSYDRLKEILQNVNDLYAGKLYNFGEGADMPSENIHVQFELALYDESGKKLKTPRSGIYQILGEYPIDCNSFMNQTKKKNKII